MPIQLDPERLSDDNENPLSYRVTLRDAPGDIIVSASEGYEVSMDNGENFGSDLRLKPKPVQKPPRIINTILVRKTNTTINSGKIVHSVVGSDEEAVVLLISPISTYTPPSPLPVKHVGYSERILNFESIPPYSKLVKSLTIKSMGISIIGLKTNEPYSLSIDNINFNEEISLNLDAAKELGNKLYVQFNPVSTGVYDEKIAASYDGKTDEIRLTGRCKKKKSLIIFLILFLLIGLGIVGYLFRNEINGLFNRQPQIVNSISGQGHLCKGNTIVLVTSIPDGTWSVDNSSVVTIDNKSGTLTGIAAGTATISYRISTDRFTTKMITVDEIPFINGSAQVIVREKTTWNATLPNGSWSSNKPDIAEIDSKNGEITGISPGTASIIYKSVAGCEYSKQITISAPSGTPGPTKIYKRRPPKSNPGKPNNDDNPEGIKNVHKTN